LIPSKTVDQQIPRNGEYERLGCARHFLLRAFDGANENVLAHIVDLGLVSPTVA
jgi:hypothetical protein